MVLAYLERAILAHWNAAAQWVAAHAIDRSIYSTLLGGIAGIAGVFIGLYFTTVSLVASSSYRDVPADVRDVVVAEKVGSVYMSLVAHVGAASLLMLAAISIDWKPGFINFALIVLLAAIAVFSFVSLGARAFTLFDPSILVRFLGHRILDAAKAATSKGLHWKDPSFQAAYHREAESAANTYLSVTKLTVASSTRMGDSLTMVARHALALLELYSECKADIPSESRWFKRVAYHPSWLTASETDINFGLQHGMGLRPKEQPDQFWLETKLMSAFSDALSELENQSHFEAIFEVGSHAQRLVASLAERFMFTTAIRLHRAMLPVAQKVMRSAQHSDNESAERRLHRLAVIEVLANGPVALIVSLGKAAEALTVEDLKRFTAKSINQPIDAPIGRSGPDEVRSTIEFLRRAATFEQAAEGTRVTPEWFALRQIARGYAKFLAEAVTIMLDEAEAAYLKELHEIVAAQRHEAAVIVIQMGLRACARLDHHAGVVAHCIERLKELDRPIDDIEWPKLDFDTASARLTSIRDTLVSSLARSAPHLDNAVPSGELPDDFGYAYATLAQECFNALVSGSTQVFEVAFPVFFHLNLRAFERVRNELSGHRLEAQTVIAADIILDLLELSGYAFVLSELGESGGWNVVQERWEQYLNNNPKSHEALGLFVGLLDYRKRAFSVSTREFIRTGWHKAFNGLMRTRGHLRDSYHYFNDQDDDDLTTHGKLASPVVRAFIREHSVFSAGDLFAACILVKRKEFIGIPVPRSVQSLIRELHDVEESP